MRLHLLHRYGRPFHNSEHGSSRRTSCIFSLSSGLLFTIVMVAFAAVCAFANPSMLPKHEGKDKDPVTGQSLSNDPGQKNASGEKALQQAAAAEDGHIRQNLRNPNDERLLEKPGAGVSRKFRGSRSR